MQGSQLLEFPFTSFCCRMDHCWAIHHKLNICVEAQSLQSRCERVHECLQPSRLKCTWVAERNKRGPRQLQVPGISRSAELCRKLQTARLSPPFTAQLARGSYIENAAAQWAYNRHDRPC